MILENLASWCLQNNFYTMQDILNGKNPFSLLRLQILDNKLYIIDAEYACDGKMEQRQASICMMVEQVLRRYELPNLIFNYNTWDRTPNKDMAFFTHARLKNTACKNVLAPCFTFYGYPENQSFRKDITTYAESYDELLYQNNIPFSKKENTCVFVGTCTDNNYRKENTKLYIDKSINLIIEDQGAAHQNFRSRSHLKSMKYLLHLNGNGGAYSSRLKYLLGCQSVVFYNTNSGHENNHWEEWWMKDDVFIPNHHYIVCKNVQETSEWVNYYNLHSDQAEIIANNSRNFFVNFLTPDNVLLFWHVLLSKYRQRCNFEIKTIEGREFKSTQEIF